MSLKPAAPHQPATVATVALRPSRFARYLGIYAALWRNSVTRETMFKGNFLLWIIVEVVWFALQLSFIHHHARVPEAWRVSALPERYADLMTRPERCAVVDNDLAAVDAAFRAQGNDIACVIVEPIMSDAFDGVYEQRKDEWKAVFTQRDGIPRAYHEEPVMYGFGMAPELPDGMPVNYDQGGILFNKRYVYKVFGLAYALTQVLAEDGDAIRLGINLVAYVAAERQLGETQAVTREIQAPVARPREQFVFAGLLRKR